MRDFQIAQGFLPQSANEMHALVHAKDWSTTRFQRATLLSSP